MAGRKSTTSDVRFAEKVRLDKSGCEVWTSGKTGNGYGLFCVEGKMKLAHRWRYEQVNGEIPLGYDCCHKCDNPPCVRLDHLFIATRKGNMEDAVKKGRTSHVPRVEGERHPMAVLNESKVKEIRQRRQAGEPLGSLAIEFEVSIAQISRIAHNQCWKGIV